MAVASSADREENYIWFNYTDSTWGQARGGYFACDTLLASDMSVLIVGEGNYSFATALAAIRNGWKNVYVSQYPREDPPEFNRTVSRTALHAAWNVSEIFMESDEIFDDFKDQFPTFSDTSIKILLNSIGLALRNMTFKKSLWKKVWETDITQKLNRELEAVAREIKEAPIDSYKDQARDQVLTLISPILKRLEELQAPTIISKGEANPIELGINEEGWLSQKVDATQLPMFVLNEKAFFPRSIIFQCPYDHSLEYIGTEALIYNLFESAKNLMSPPDYIFIGVANKFPYIKNYGLGAVLGRPSPRYWGGPPIFQKNAMMSICCEAGYEFLGADVQFAKEILQCGYKHEVNFCRGRDVHFEIFNDHVMLCFKRQNIKEDSEEK